MALVASSCSRLTWLLGPSESSPLGSVLCSFPLALLTPFKVLKNVLSFPIWPCAEIEPRRTLCTVPLQASSWLPCGEQAESGGSSSLLILVEARDSRDTDRLSPLMMVLKLKAREFSESSVPLSWKTLSLLEGSELTAGGVCVSASASSCASAGGSQSEIRIEGRVTLEKPRCHPVWRHQGFLMAEMRILGAAMALWFLSGFLSEGWRAAEENIVRVCWPCGLCGAAWQTAADKQIHISV